MSNYTQARDRQLSNIRAYENRVRQSLTRATAGPSGPAEIASRGGGFATVGESYGPGTRAQSAAASSYGYFKSWVYVSVDAIARRAAGQPFCAAEMEGAEPTEGQRGPVRYGSKGPRVNPPWASKAIPSGILERATVNQELTVYQSHAVLDLLARPNPLQKKSEFVYMTIANILLTGESFWIGGEDDAGNFELWAVPTHWVIPDHSRGMYASYKLQLPGAAVPKDLPDGAVCRIYLPNPSDLKSALSPLSTAIRAIRVDDHIQASQEEMFKRGINPNLIVTIGKVRGEDGNLTDRRPVLRGSHRRQIIRAIREIWDQTVSSGDPAILDGLIESVHKLHNTPQEMDWPGSGEIVKKRVMQAYKVNPIVVGEITAGNRAQAVEAEKNFCHDESTQCLTKSGWVDYDRIYSDTEIACYDANTGAVVYAKPTAVHVLDHDGPMHRWLASGVDALMTPDHRCWVQTFEKPGHLRRRWSYRTAGDLAETTVYRIKQCGVALADLADDSDIMLGSDCRISRETWCDLIGWFASEGHYATNSEGIAISQSLKSPHWKTVDALFRTIGLPFSTSLCGEKRDVQQWKILETSSPGIVAQMRGACGDGGSDKKQIPTDVKGWSSIYLARILDAACYGDAHCTSAITRTYTSTSKQLADDIQEIAVKCGWRAWISPKTGPRENRKPSWDVNLHRTDERTIKGIHRTVEHYAGKVWCVTVPTGLFFVRRGGAVHVSGNCSNAVNPLVSSISDAATDYLGPRYQTGKPLVVYLELAQPIDPEQQLREWTEARKNEDVTANEFRAQILGIAPLDDRDDPSRLLTQQGGLTGITTLMEKVGAGSITPEQAAETLVVTLRLPRDQAEKIAGVGIERPEPPAPPPVPVPVPPPEPPVDDEDDDEQSDDEPPEPTDDNPADESGGERAARPFGRYRSIRDFIQARAKSASTAVERRAGQDLARYFRGSVRRITDGILGVDWIPNPANPERQAETLLKIAFDGPSETRKLKEAATDSMLHAFAVGAMTEIQTLAEIVRGRNRKTTAEDIAARLGYDVPDGVSIGQYPDWLQRAAVDSLGDTFSQDYWTDVPQTTATDIYNVLVSAIREGHSITRIASEIARQCGPAYSLTRARNVARTEMTGAMNAGHVAGMVQIQEETGLPIGKEWVSVMGSTTRDSHAAADGQQSADPDGLFRLASYSVPYPGHHSLPAAERCNCQCTAISSIVMDGLEDAVADTPVEPATPDAWDQASVDKMDAKTIVADHPALQEKLSRVLELRDSYKPKMGELGREYEDVRQQIRSIEKQFDDLISVKHPAGSDEERRQIEQTDLLESQRKQLAKRRDEILGETKQIAAERREKTHKILTIKTETRLGAKASYLKHTKNDPLATELDDEGYRLSLGGYPDEFKKKVGEAQEFLGKVVAKPREGDLSMTNPKEPFSKSEDTWAKTIQIHRSEDGCRSRHIARTSKWKGELLRDAGVYCTNKDNTEIIVHEMAHHLEASVPGIAKRSREFQKYRIAKSGRPNVKMRTVFPESGYGAREVGNEDDFGAAFDQYSWKPGKEYPSDRVDKTGAKSSAFYAGKNYNNKETELTSMGMELLYVDPAGFAARDPEFFKFIVGTLDGTIR